MNNQLEKLQFLVEVSGMFKDKKVDTTKKPMFLDLRYNDFFYIQATGRIKKNITLVKMIYQKKHHLNGWMGLDQFEYNVKAGGKPKKII